MRPIRTRGLRSGRWRLLFLVWLVALAACTTAEPSPVGDDQQQLFDAQCADEVIPDLPDLGPVDATAGVRDVDTEFGAVELPTAPQASLGVYTTDVDILIWLGFPLADHQPIRGDSGYRTFPCYFPRGPLDGVTGFANFPDFDEEQIAVAEPDFILNGLGYDHQLVEQLPMIAPTYSVNAFDGQGWQRHFEQTAADLGRSDRYRLWQDLYDERLAQVRVAIGDQSGVTAAPVTSLDGRLELRCAGGVECQVLADLGFAVSPLAGAMDGQGTALGPSHLDRIEDVDWIFMTRGVGDVGEAEYQARLAELDQNRWWSELPAVRAEHLADYEVEMSFGSPSAQLAFLDVVEAALAP